MRKQRAEVGKIYRTALVPELRSIDEESRTIEFVASTEAVDRYGDVIRVAGWKLDAYKKNPVFLWAHKSGEPPIGKTVGIHVETSPVPALVQKVEFADAATYPFADTVYNLYKGKFLRAVSVGFMPLEAPKRIKNEQDETTGWEFTNQELLELSAVPVPANPEAVARMVSKGFAEADLARAFAPQMSPEEVYRELISIHQEISSIAVGVATAAVRKALAAIKARRPEGGGEFSLEELLALVKQTVPKTEHGTDLDQLGEALETEGDITSIEQFERALAAGGGGEEQVSDGEEVFSDSRRWRTGKFSIVRELGR